MTLPSGPFPVTTANPDGFRPAAAPPAVTALDYHAAHAPPCPDSFRAAGDLLPEKPASVAEYERLSEEHGRKYGTSHVAAADWHRWHEERSAAVDRLNAAGRACADDRTAWAEACRDVERGNALAREITWRWHWAKLMLKGRP